jgi:glyoxylase-like metal-dependent hydrolase (beta-lactamase superfamily II)
MGAEIVADGIYLIGGPNISHAMDATVFIIEYPRELVMIDSGAGKSSQSLLRNMEDAGLNPEKISTIILTHCHIDHIGSAPFFRNRFGCRIIAHDPDAGAIETADPSMTAASWYGVRFPPTPVDRILKGDHDVLTFGDEELHSLHTPGHTPGSIVLYLDRAEKRILFGQDIHGPFHENFQSDIRDWRRSMEKLLDLHADILCEGHFGIFSTKDRVASYIRNQLRQNT